MAYLLTSIDSLSNEVLIQILSLFTTRSLIPLAVVCRRWRGLVGRLHYGRLAAATRLQMRNHELLLESYHPIDKLTTPSLFCEYIGTDGLSEAVADANMAALNCLYTRFRPSFGEKHERPFDEVPSQKIHLESEEVFSQLCVTVELVQNGPIRGLFASSALLCDHVIRIQREYLRREAAASAIKTQQQASSESGSSSILWTDLSENVGLKLRVIEDRNASVHTLVRGNDDPPVSYRLEYQELLIRTNELYVSLEVSESQQIQHAGDVLFLQPSMADKCAMTLYKHLVGPPSFVTTVAP